MPRAKKAPARRRAIPKPSRPVMPEGYQLKKGPGFLPWSGLDEQFARAHNYWVATCRPDGRPHVMPVWGVWADGMFTFSTDRFSRKARNLASNPGIVVHLESGDEVGILEGVAEEVTDRKLLAKIDDVFEAKYGMRVSTIQGDVVIYGMRPRVAFAWREKDFNVVATRWVFDGG